MPRLLEWLEWIGLREAFEKHGIHRTRHEFWGKSRKFLTLDFGLADSVYGYTLNLPQHTTETLLEQFAINTGYVEILRNHRVTHINQTDENAEVTAEVSGKLINFRARYGVGCDGAKSSVRDWLGINLNWKDYGTDSAVADFEMDTGLDPEVSTIHQEARRPYGHFCFNPGKWRFIYRLNNGEDRRALTTEKAATELMLAKTPGAKVKKFLWASAFRLGQGQSSTYRRARWLLAGDAAHAMGPSAGAGMMLGLMGAWRLGWRLAYLCRGDFNDEHILEDYAREQNYAAVEIQNSNRLMFRNMAVRNPLIAAVRNAGLLLAGNFSSVGERIVNLEAVLLQNLPVKESVDTIKFQTLRSMKTVGQWQSGKRIPKEIFKNSDWKLDRFRSRHSIISLGRALPNIKDLVVRIIAQTALPIDYSGHFDGMDEDQTALVLVRPDQHISFIGGLTSPKTRPV